MVKVSQKFLVSLKLHSLPQYKIAQAAKVDPIRLSKLVNGAEMLKMGDPRIVAVGRVLGVPESECFDTGGGVRMSSTPDDPKPKEKETEPAADPENNLLDLRQSVSGRPRRFQQ